MMDDQKPLLPGSCYHIYNHSNGTEDLFRNSTDYHHFLNLYNTYIHPIADTFAWILMPNHFHFMIRIKEHIYYKYSWTSKGSATVISNVDRSSVKLSGLTFDDVKWETMQINLSASAGPDSVDDFYKKKPNPANHFSHLFNAYTKYFNKKYDRRGSLFQRKFKRKIIDDERYFTQLIVYIHNNPIHHGFVEHIEDWPHSSWFAYQRNKPTKIKKEEALNWFGGLDNFDAAHEDVKYDTLVSLFED